MYRASVCGLYTYILALEIADCSAYRPSSVGWCTYIRALKICDGSAYRPSSCGWYTYMHTYVHTHGSYFHFGVGWHVDAEPSFGLVGCSSAPRALARVNAHFFA